MERHISARWSIYYLFCGHFFEKTFSSISPTVFSLHTLFLCIEIENIETIGKPFYYGINKNGDTIYIWTCTRSPMPSNIVCISYFENTTTEERNFLGSSLNLALNFFDMFIKCRFLRSMGMKKYVKSDRINGINMRLELHSVSLSCLFFNLMLNIFNKTNLKESESVMSK